MQIRGTILQPWNWHSPKLDANHNNLYQRLEVDAAHIKKMGFTAVWLPPVSKGVGDDTDVGYGIKNWYELDNTKYGSKDELRKACQALSDLGINIYHDQVHNHLMGGEIETDVWCLHVKCNNKNEPLDDTRVWFQADIPTSYPWLALNHSHFDAYHPNGHDCWILSGKQFDKEAKQDPLMGCDLDFDSLDLVKKLETFGIWFKDEIKTDGYRFDAVKHIRPKGTLGFLSAMRFSENKNMFAVAEYFDSNIDELHHYIKATNSQISLFDFPLQRKLVDASRNGNAFDMQSLALRTLTHEQPVLSVSFVHSHDDQPPFHGGEHRGEYVGDWFIAQSYAMILLRDEGYPLVADVDMFKHKALIKRLLLARTHCTFGYRYDRFDHNNTIGWSFTGGEGYDNSMAVVMTNGERGWKWLPTQKPYLSYRDITDSLNHSIVTNEYGWAEFECAPGGTSVWVEESKYLQLLNLLNG